MQLHAANLHQNMSTECSICQKNLANKHLLQVHLKEAHPDESALFQCLECSAKEYTLLHAWRHYRVEHKEKPYRCFKCQ